MFQAFTIGQSSISNSGITAKQMASAPVFDHHPATHHNCSHNWYHIGFPGNKELIQLQAPAKKCHTPTNNSHPQQHQTCNRQLGDPPILSLRHDSPQKMTQSLPTIRFHGDLRHREHGPLGAFQLHMKIARGRTAGPAILGRANKSSHDILLK
jgi:hypothetical protein